MAKIKDIDYLFASTWIRMLERGLLSRERMEQMVEARSAEDAAKVLTECGYPEMDAMTPSALEEALAGARKKTFDGLYTSVPDRSIIDVFKIKFDYHNVKVILKADAQGLNAEKLLVDTGRVQPRVLLDAVHQNDLRSLPSRLAHAIPEAQELLSVTSDPQQVDFLLDRAYYEEMAEIARASGSAFLEGYVRLSIDAANLRSAVRTLRMQKSAEFLKNVLFSGGNIDTGRTLVALTSGSSIEELYHISPLRDAAAVGVAAVQGGSLTRFEKLCDDALTKYLKGAKLVGFGEQPVIGYLAARESELTAVRIIMTGRMAGLAPDTIRERLREAYV